MTVLLFDQNLSPRLVTQLADIFPGSMHVSLVGLAEAFDRTVWEFAKKHDMVLVSKDADIGDLGFLFGFPPQVVWIRRGNCSTKKIEQILRANRESIDSLANAKENHVLVLF